MLILILIMWSGGSCSDTPKLLLRVRVYSIRLDLTPCQFRKETEGWATFILPPLIVARAEIWKSLPHCSLSLAPLKIHPVLMEKDPFLWARGRPAVVCRGDTRHSCETARSKPYSFLTGSGSIFGVGLIIYIQNSNMVATVGIIWWLSHTLSKHLVGKMSIPGEKYRSQFPGGHRKRL